MPVVTYSTSVSPAVTQETAAGFAREVDRVLGDPRGWKKYGFEFVRSAGLPDVHIHLETAADAARACGTGGFSCWREGRPGGRMGDIVIHEENWVGGSASSLPVERYHNYVINHEWGHALGLDHQPCPAAECARRGMRSCPASVMMQMTRGPAHVRPCVESDWPLDPDWSTDDPTRVPGGPFGARRGVCATLVVLVAIVVIIVTCLLIGLAGAGSTGVKNEESVGMHHNGYYTFR